MLGAATFLLLLDLGSALQTSAYQTVAPIPKEYSNVFAENHPRAVSAGVISFATPSTHRLPVYPTTVNVADMNGDNRKDIIVGTLYYLHIYYQKANGTFDKSQVYRAGSIRALEIGDLNNDSLTDIAAAVDTTGESPNSPTCLKIWFQLPGGKLQDGGLYPIGIDGSGVAIGDLNNDGLRDIAVSHMDTDSLRLLYQTSPGVFDSSVFFPTFHNVRVQAIVRAGDFNGDGLTDLIQNTGPDRWNSGVSLFLQHADGKMRYEASTDTIWGLDDVTVGDFNTDGRTDFSMTNMGNHPNEFVIICLQDSNGQIVKNAFPYEAYDSGLGTCAGDFDLDGRTDLALIHYGWQKISVLRQNENGEFYEQFLFNSPYYQVRSGAVTAADVNNDQKTDLVFVDPNYDLVIYLNQTTPGSRSVTFSSPMKNDNSPTYEAAIHDQPGSTIKRSGLVVDVHGEPISGLARKSDWKKQAVSAESKYNWDGTRIIRDGLKFDRLEVESLTDTIRFDSNVVRPGIPDLNCVRIADMNHDGRNDCVVGVATSFPLNERSILYYFQDSLGHLIDPPFKYAGAQVRSMDVADLNLDGLTDLVILDGGVIRTIYQTPDSLEERPFPIADSDAASVCLGDLNNDGIPDLVVSYYVTSHLRIYFQNPIGVFSSTIDMPAKDIGGFGESVVEISDATGDGLNDVILGGGHYNEAVSIYKQTSPGTFELYQNLGVPSYLQDVAIADFTGDGRKDIAACLTFNMPHTYTLLFVQDSLGRFPEVPEFYEGYQVPDAMEVGDFDKDGRIDLAVASWGWYRISIFRQRSIGGFEPYVLAGFSYGGDLSHRGLAVGDITNDGLPDMATVGYYNGLNTMINRTNVSTAIGNEDEGRPISFSLSQNYPNPFNPRTSISYSINSTTNVRLEVFDLLGKKVMNPVDQTQLPGRYTASLDLNKLASGIYLYRLTTGSGSITRKMVLMR